MKKKDGGKTKILRHLRQPDCKQENKVRDPMSKGVGEICCFGFHKATIQGTSFDPDKVFAMIYDHDPAGDAGDDPFTIPVPAQQGSIYQNSDPNYGYGSKGVSGVQCSVNGTENWIRVQPVYTINKVDTVIDPVTCSFMGVTASKIDCDDAQT